MNYARRIYRLAELPHSEAQRVAAYVAAFTQSSEGVAAELLPLAPTRVLERSIGFVACVGDTFVGYTGSREPVDGADMVELGPFIVVPEHRRKGHGTALLAMAAQTVVHMDKTPFVLGNQANMGNLL